MTGRRKTSRRAAPQQSAARATAVAIVALLALACGPDARPHDRLIVLIVLDTASAHYMGAWGEPLDTTPRIDRLAAEAVVFDRAYSQSSTTTASTASLFTGVRVTTHKVYRIEPYAAELRPIAELLADGGFTTRAVVGNYYAGAPELGFDRGFDHAVRAWESTGPDDPREGFRGDELKITRPAEISELALQQIDAAAGQDAFHYIHYLRPHEPYDAPLEYRQRFQPETPRCRATIPDWTMGHRKQRLEDNVDGTTRPCTRERSESLYRATLRWTDDGVARLIDGLKERGLYDDALIVLTSDHGEAFFGHGVYGHNLTLYDDMTRIPLLLKLPAREGVAPRRLSNLVETIDVAPTLLDFAGLDVPDWLEGDSLLPLVRGETAEIEGDEVVISTIDRRSHAIRVGRWKYIRRLEGDPELYDIERDPAEQHDLAEREPARVAELERRLEAIVSFDAGELSALPRVPDEVKVRKLLEQLGYVEDTP